MNVYCASCGWKTEYSGVKPKCCSGCGKPFDAAFKVAAASPQRQPRQVASTQYSAPESDEVILEDLSLDPSLVRVESDGSAPQRMTIEQARNSSATFSRGSRPSLVTEAGDVAKIQAEKDAFLRDMLASANSLTSQPVIIARDDSPAPVAATPSKRKAGRPRKAR